MSLVQTVGALLAAAGLASAGGVAVHPETNAPAALLLDGIAAEVGETRITIAEAMVAARELAAELRLAPAEQNARLRELYASALDELIARQLVLEAYRKAENKLQPWVVDRRMDELISDRFDGDRAAFVAALARQHLTLESWRQRAEEEMAISAMRHQHVDQRVSVAPADVRAAYATNRAAYTLAGPVRVGLILLRAEEGETPAALLARGRALRQRLDDGQDFGELARRHSSDSRAATGGDWGFVEPGQLFRPEIVAALTRLAPGACSAPLSVGRDVYLVRKMAERPDRQQTLEDAWPEIEARLRGAAAAELYRAWIARLRRDAYVRVNPLP